MTPIKTPYSNITYVAEGCNDLPATITRSPSGQNEVETCWELTDEEVEQVIKNRKVYLYIMGTAVPPLNDPAKKEGCSTWQRERKRRRELYSVLSDSWRGG